MKFIRFFYGDLFKNLKKCLDSNCPHQPKGEHKGDSRITGKFGNPACENCRYSLI